MASTKISAGADPVTLVATDKVPMARSASTTAYAATMTEVRTFALAGTITPAGITFTVLPVNAANDSAAAAAGVVVGGVYRTGSALMIRTV